MDDDFDPDRYTERAFERFIAGPSRKGVGNGTAPTPSTAWAMSLSPATGIKPQAIRWLWKGWLACGKMHVIAGQPGAGKTTLAMKMGATVSIGGRWPDGTSAQRGNVVVWSGEDDPGDTLVPRLEASGADLARVFFASDVTCGRERRPFDPAKDIDALKLAIKAAGGASFIVIDPIVSATAADSHKNGETRRALQPLVDMAAELDAALVGVTHFTKGSEGKAPIDRVTGSVAFGALARVVMIAARQQDDEDGQPGPRVIMRAKSNIGPDDGGFNYELQLVPMREQPDIVASVVAWGDAVDGAARAILAEAENNDGGEAKSAFREAKDFLFNLLIDGPKPVKEIKKEAADFGVSWRTIERAKRELGIRARKGGIDTGWEWSIPEDRQDHQDRQP